MALAVEIKRSGKMEVLSKVLNTGIKIGLSWDPATTGIAADADLFLAVTKLQNGVYFLPTMDYLIYHANLKTPNGEITHSGDETKGSKDGDDESITGFLNKLPQDVTHIWVGVAIDQVKSPGMNLGQVKNLTLTINQIVEGQPNVEKVGFVKFDNHTSIGLIAGNFHRTQSGWEFSNMEEQINCTSLTPIQDVLEAIPCDCLG